MKKKKILVVAFVSVLFSCNKADKAYVAEVSNNNAENITSAEEKNNNMNTNIKGHHTLGTVYNINSWIMPAGDCIPVTANCVTLPLVIITANTAMIDDLEDAESQGDPALVAEIFNGAVYDDLRESLNSDLVDNLLSGNYYVMKNYEDGEKVNFAFGVETPVTIENLEFALEFSK